MCSHDPHLRCANPSFTESEFTQQITETKAKFIITHPGCFAATIAAAKRIHFPLNSISTICPPRQSFHEYSSQYHGLSGVSPSVHSMGGFATLDALIGMGLTKYNVEGKIFSERRLTKGEAKTKLAFLSFSSGTTGKPKVRKRSFFAAEVIL